MEACKRIATTSIRDPKRRRPDGKTTFNVSFYAVSKDGKFFGGCIYPGGKMAVHDGDSADRQLRALFRQVRLRPPYELLAEGVRSQGRQSTSLERESKSLGL